MDQSQSFSTRRRSAPNPDHRSWSRRSSSRRASERPNVSFSAPTRDYSKIDPKDPSLTENDKKMIVIEGMERLVYQVQQQRDAVSVIQAQVRVLIDYFRAEMEAAVLAEARADPNKPPVSRSTTVDTSPPKSVSPFLPMEYAFGNIVRSENSSANPDSQLLMPQLSDDDINKDPAVFDSSPKPVRINDMSTGRDETTPAIVVGSSPLMKPKASPTISKRRTMSLKKPNINKEFGGAGEPFPDARSRSISPNPTKRRPVSLSPNIGGVEQLVLQHEITESMSNISGIVNSKSNFGLLVVPEVGGPSGQPSPIPTLKRSLSSKQSNEPRTIPTLSPETVTPRTTTSEQSKSFGHTNNIRNSAVSLKIVEDYEKGQLSLQESHAPKGIRKSLKQLALFVMGESVGPMPAMPIIGVESSGHERSRLASIKDTGTTAREDNLNPASAKRLPGIITMGRTSKTGLVFSNNELRTSQTSPKGRPKSTLYEESILLLEDHEKGNMQCESGTGGFFTGLLSRRTSARRKSSLKSVGGVMMLAPNTPKVPVLPSEFATLKFTKGTIRRSGSLTSPNSQPTPMTLHAPLSSGRISKRRFSSSGNRKKSFGPASVKSFEDVTTPMVKESPLFYDVDEPSIDEPHKPLECNNYSIFKSLFTPIRPDGRFKNNWMQLVSLAYFYVLAVVPYRIAFLDGLDKTQSMILTIIFGIDTTINLITLRVNDDGFEIPFLPSLVRNFFSIPFLVDVASTVPWSLYFQNNCCDTDRWNSNGFDLIRLARLFRLSKIMKTPFYRQMARTMRETLGLGNNFMALFTFFCIIVVFLHFNGCFIILMGRDNAFRDKAWLKMQPQNMMPPEKYSQGMWMALANMIPVTFKAWRPDTLNAQWSELFFCLFGAIASASITGTISALSLGEQSPAGKFIQRLDQLKEWLHARKADETYLESRVMKGYNLKYQGKVFDEEQILSELNPWLRQEILLFGCEDILKSVPFFQRDEDDGRNELLFRTIAELLERTSFSPGECICKQNDCGDEMYFLLEGRVSIMKDGVFMGYVEEGSYFGELSMFTDIQRPATMTAVTGCQCRVLRRGQLLKILEEYPDISVKLMDYYNEKMAAMEEAVSKMMEEQEYVDVDTVLFGVQEEEPNDVDKLISICE